MVKARNIIYVFLFLIGVILLSPVMDSCERFDPASELYFYTDTIILQSRGTYVLSGAIVNLGKDEINQHGFCWSDSENPTVDKDSSTRLGIISAPGEFSCIVSGLNANTTYYVRVYATTDSKTEYSKEKSFSTPAPTLPIVIIDTITEISVSGRAAKNDPAIFALAMASSERFNPDETGRKYALVTWASLKSSPPR